MLMDFETGKVIDRIPHPENLELVDRMTNDESQAINNELNAMINRDLEAGSDIQTAGWMPGSDWTGTPFEAIYETAARRNTDVAALVFGFMVWMVFREREDDWYTGRFEKDGEPLSSRTYFRARD